MGRHVEKGGNPWVKPLQTMGVLQKYILHFRNYAQGTLFRKERKELENRWRNEGMC